MDDATDLALYKIEREIIRNRQPRPCPDYEATSKLIDLCSNCGWRETAHERR